MRARYGAAAALLAMPALMAGSVATAAATATSATCRPSAATTTGAVGDGSVRCSVPPTANSNLASTAAPTASALSRTPPTSAFPNATNTGYRHAPGYSGSLKSAAGLAIVSGGTYTGYDFGPIDIGSPTRSVQNVTFVGCRFKGSGDKLVGVFGSNITFRWTSFEPSAAAAPVAHNQGYQYGISTDGAYNTHAEGLTLDHIDMWGFANAVTLTTSTASAPVVIRDSWIHDARRDGGQDHTDGPGQIGGSHAMSNVVIDHNTIESAGNTNALAFQYGPYSDFQITGNLFGGFGYGIFLSTVNGPNQRTTFTGNTWSTRLANVFGPVYPLNFWTGNGNLWRGNHWLSTNADNGKFWTPNGPASTDYTG